MMDGDMMRERWLREEMEEVEEEHAQLHTDHITHSCIIAEMCRAGAPLKRSYIAPAKSTPHIAYM